MIYSIFPYLILTWGLFTSCKEVHTAKQKDFKYALVLFTGNPEVDGCGFILEINKKQYKPLNLQSEYQKDSMQLEVVYEIDPTGFPCGDLPYPKTTINLLDVRRY